MSDNLVRRLRDVAEFEGLRVAEEAADRIEELENRLEKEMSDLDAADRRITRLQARIQELEEQNKRLRLEVAHANDTADVAIERVEELEANLAKAELIVRIIAGDKWNERLGEVVDLSCEYLAELTGGKDE